VRSACALLLLLSACKTADGISRDLGAACDTHDDCTDTCLPSPDWPHGFCSRPCLATDDCPVGGECVTTPEGDVCLFLCYDDRDCAFLEDPGVTDDDWPCVALTDPEGASFEVCAPGTLPVIVPLP